MDTLLPLPARRFKAANGVLGYPEQPLCRVLDTGARQPAKARGFAVVALVNPKTPSNIGAVLRAGGCYQTALVVLGGARPARLSRLATDTQKAWRHIPSVLVPDVFDAIPYDCVPVAIDLIPGARSLVTYAHPERAFYIFGAEDATLGKAVTERCRDVIYVPTTYCMNLAAAVNVVLYDRLAKQSLGRAIAATRPTQDEEG